MQAQGLQKAHAVFGASSSERWLNCPASVALCDKAPPSKSSSYAEEGTTAHEVLEHILNAYINGGKPRSTALMLKKKYPEEMVDHAMEAFRWIEREHSARVGATVLCETRCELPVSEPDQFGTTDAAIVELFGRLTVIDYKYGAGIPVEVEENSQLIYYALGLAHKYDYNFAEVEIVVIQPRAEHERGPVRSWVTTIEHLQHWQSVFQNGIDTAKDPKAPFATGKWCRFCPAATICPEVSTRSLAQAKVDFEPFNGDAAALVPVHSETSGLSDFAVANILDAAPRIRAWLDAVEEHAAHAIERGESIPGYKLVAKRSTRKWVNPEKLEKKARRLFGDRAFSEPELLSPAQLEKALAGLRDPGVAGFIADNTTSLSSGTTLVPDSDKRPAVNPIQNDFVAIPEGGEAIDDQKKIMSPRRRRK